MVLIVCCLLTRGIFALHHHFLHWFLCFGLCIFQFSIRCVLYVMYSLAVDCGFLVTDASNVTTWYIFFYSRRTFFYFSCLCAYFSTFFFLVFFLDLHLMVVFCGRLTFTWLCNVTGVWVSHLHFIRQTATAAWCSACVCRECNRYFFDWYSAVLD